MYVYIYNNNFEFCVGAVDKERKLPAIALIITIRNNIA